VACESPGTLPLGRPEIEARIPHRAPFLFVDRVLELSDEAITSEWNILPELPFLAGHYPGDPIVPGVLVNEFVFQSAAILMSEPEEGRTSSGAVPVLTRVEDARFKRMVRPGAVLRAEVTLTDRLGPACYMKARVTSAGELVARLVFVVALTTPEVSA
jgi:3-hydroxyacyl-[acyl-carrier-protein] dehydratase